MARFTAMQASRLKAAQQLHLVRELLYGLKTEKALCGADLIELDQIDDRVTDLLSKLIPNQATEA